MLKRLYKYYLLYFMLYIDACTYLYKIIFFVRNIDSKNMYIMFTVRLLFSSIKTG